MFSVIRSNDGQAPSFNIKDRTDHPDPIYLPEDCTQVIFNFFSCKELLVLEQVHKGMNVLTKKRWQHFYEEQKVKVNWSNLFNMQSIFCLDKFNYRTDRALRCFLNERKALIRHTENRHFPPDDFSHIRMIRYLKECSERDKCLQQKITKLNERFESICHWHPCLASYIKNDLQKIIKWDTPHEGRRILKLAGIELEAFVPPFVPFLNLFNPTRILSNFSTQFGKLQPGELLLRGLSLITDYQLQCHKLFEEKQMDDLLLHPVRFQLFSAYVLLKSAQEKGIDHASLLAYKAIVFQDNNDLEEMSIDLAMFSASQGDYLPLEKFLAKISKRPSSPFLVLSTINSIIERYQCYPPLLISLVNYNLRGNSILSEQVTLRKVEEAEKDFHKGIEGYLKANHPIPGETWFVGAYIKFKLGELKKAEAYMNDAMAAFGRNIPFEAWTLRAEIQEELGDAEGAIFALQKVIDACNRYLEDDDQVQEKYNNNDPATLLYYMGKRCQLVSQQKRQQVKDRLAHLQASLGND